MSGELEKIYKPIGELIVKFQELELFITSLIVEISRIDYDIGFCLTSESSFSRLTATLSAVSALKVKNDELKNRITELVKRLNTAEQNRNKIVHSLYIEVDGKIKRSKITAKQKTGLQKWLYDVSIEEINDYIADIADLKVLILGVARDLKKFGFISNAFFR